VRAPLLFPPGTQVRYQSMGFLLAAAIASVDEAAVPGLSSSSASSRRSA
jgi:hypothetical protein